MGSSQSCNPCSPDDSLKDNVVVMKEGGEALELKAGTKVYHVLAEYPFHKMIRCCSDRTVLPEDFTLNCRSLYFLLPQGLSLSDATYKSLVNSAVSKQLILLKPVVRPPHPQPEYDDVGANNISSSNTEMESVDRNGENDKYICRRFAAWKPVLKPIPEVISASPTPPCSAET